MAYGRLWWANCWVVCYHRGKEVTALPYARWDEAEKEAERLRRDFPGLEVRVKGVS